MEPDAQAHLSRDLKERLQNSDKQEAIELYFELLGSGHSIKEILSAVEGIQSTSERDDSATAEGKRSELDNWATDPPSEDGLVGALQADIRRTGDRTPPDDADLRTPEQPQSAEGEVRGPEELQAAEPAPPDGPGPDSPEQLPPEVSSGYEPDIAGPADTPITAIPSNEGERSRPGMFSGSVTQIVFAAFSTVTITGISIAGLVLLQGGRDAAPATAAIQPDTPAASSEAPRIVATQTAKAAPDPETPQTHPDKPANAAEAASATAVGVGSEVPAAAPTAAPAIPRANGASPDTPRLTAAQTDALLARGDTFLAAGDVASARLFYEYAALAGNAAAALRLGGTFDPAFLARARIGRIRGHVPSASYWYRRARDLGNSDAEILLRGVENTGG